MSVIQDRSLVATPSLQKVPGLPKKEGETLNPAIQAVRLPKDGEGQEPLDTLEEANLDAIIAQVNDEDVPESAKKPLQQLLDAQLRACGLPTGDGVTLDGLLKAMGVPDKQREKFEDEAEAAGLPKGGDFSYGILPGNYTFALLKMMEAIQKYERVILDSNAEMQKNWALTLGGSKDGKTIDIGSDLGMFSALAKVGFDVGAQKAAGLKDQAYGMFAQAGASGASFVAQAGSLGVSSYKQSQVSKEIAGYKKLGKDLGDGGEYGVGDKAAAEKAAQSPENAAAISRMREFASGAKRVDEYKGLDGNGKVVDEEAALNKSAFKLAQEDVDARPKIKEQLNKKIDALEHSKGNISQNAYNFGQAFKAGADGVGGGVQGYFTTQQADAANKEACDSTNQTIEGTVQQQTVEQQKKAAEQANEANSQIGQWASTFAQAAAAQVHA